MLPCSRMVSILQKIPFDKTKLNSKLYPKNVKRKTRVWIATKILDRNYCLLLCNVIQNQCYKRNELCNFLFASGVKVSLHWPKLRLSPRPRSKWLLWNCIKVVSMNEPHWQLNFMESVSISESNSGQSEWTITLVELIWRHTCNDLGETVVGHGQTFNNQMNA